MPIPVACACGKRLQAPDDLAGKQARCPGCGAMMMVPARSAAPAAAPAPRPLQPIFDAPLGPPPPPPPPPARPAAPSMASGVDRCEYCGGAMAMGSPFQFDGSLAKPLGAGGGVVGLLLVFLIGPCPLAMIALGILAVSLIVKGFSLGYRCTQCRLAPSGMVPDEIRGHLFKQRAGTLVGAAGAGLGSLACLAFIVSVLWLSSKDDDEIEKIFDGDAATTGGEEPAPPPRREPTLGERLNDREPDVRRAALEELMDEDPESPEAVNRFQILARDTDPGIRKIAIEALGRALPPGKDEILVRALRDVDPGVQGAAAAALDARGPGAWIEALEGKDTSERAREAIARHGRAAIEPLEASLASRDREVRLASVELLIGIAGREKVEAFLPVVVAEMDQHPKGASSIRWATERLLELGPPESRRAIEALAKLLQSGYELEFRVWASEVLAGFENPGPEEGLEHLVRAAVTHGTDERIRENVVKALANVGRPAIDALAQGALEAGENGRSRYDEVLDRLDPEARIESLVSALEDADAGRRRVALQAIAKLPAGALEEARRIELVVARLADPDAWVRKTALSALGNLGSAAEGAGEALVGLLADRDIGYDVQSVLVKLGPGVVKDLVKGFGSKSTEEKKRILSVLLQFKADAKAALPILGPCLDDDQLDDIAENVLAEIGEPALPLLVKTLEEGSNAAKESAIDCMRRMGPQAAEGVDALVELHLETREERIKNLSFSAILGIREGVVPAARKGLRSKDATAKERAMYLLTRMEGEEAAEALADALDDKSPDIRSDAARHIGGFGEAARGAVRDLTKLLSDPEQRVRSEACQALGRIGREAKSALPALRNLMARDPSLKYYAESAIKRIEGED